VNTLHLSNVTLEDAGEYICLAENSHAGQAVQAMQSAWLQVLPGTTLSSSRRHSGQILPVLVHFHTLSPDFLPSYTSM